MNARSAEPFSTFSTRTTRKRINNKGLINIFERKRIADGVFFNKITDERFKENLIGIQFYLDGEDNFNNGCYSIAAGTLVEGCRKYPTSLDLCKRREELYGAGLYCTASPMLWDNRVITMRVSTIDDRYALEGEKLEEEVCELIRECLLRPLADNGRFDEKSLSLVKAEIIDAIDSLVNNKSSWAMVKCREAAYKGEPMAKSFLGTHEEAEAVTSEAAYSAYRNILSRSHAEIFTAGRSDFSASERILTEMFSEIDRSSDIAALKSAPSPLKAEPLVVKDKLPMEQAIVRMVYKSPDYEDRFALGALNVIFGTMTTSRLFTNVREKQSLCYYCASNSLKTKRSMTVYSGVEPANIERVQNAIEHELNEIRKNGVTDEELDAMRLEYRSQNALIYDSPSALSTNYLGQLTDKERFLTPEEFLSKMSEVTSDRIREMARHLKLDTIYTLSGED